MSGSPLFFSAPQNILNFSESQSPDQQKGNKGRPS